MLRLGIASLMAAVALSGAVAVAQAQGPAARLAAFLPELFPATSLADAAAGGEAGARIVALTDTQRALGLLEGDVILGVGGQRLEAAEWDSSVVRPGSGGAAPPLLVWRFVPGQRPVVPRATLAKKTLDEFVALPAADRVPMRLAVLLANQLTFVEEGAGMVLLPETGGFDAAAWLAAANPLPQVSETALHDATTALEQRVELPAASNGELDAARAHLERSQYVEAEERARRALVQALLDPARRASNPDFDAALDVFLRSTTAAAERRRQLLESEPLFALVLEAQVNRIQFLPQNTNLDVKASTGGVFLGGIRVRYPGDEAVLSDFFLIAEYGLIKNGFDDHDGNHVVSTTMQQISFELMYRPRVLSRLKPFVRGGFGIFPFTLECDASQGAVIDEIEYGALFGGGIDVLKLDALHTRFSIAGSYRIVHSKFLPEKWPLFELCRNTNLPLEGDFYDFDLDGWQVGIMLTIEP